MRFATPKTMLSFAFSRCTGLRRTRSRSESEIGTLKESVEMSTDNNLRCRAPDLAVPSLALTNVRFISGGRVIGELLLG